jgi:hypothetical protein
VRVERLPAAGAASGPSTRVTTRKPIAAASRTLVSAVTDSVANAGGSAS